MRHPEDEGRTVTIVGRRTLLTGMAAVIAAATGHRASAQSLTARTVRFTSPSLGTQATFAVLVPAGYDTSNRRYPVLYLLHGGTHNHTAYPSRSWFGKEVRGRNVIAVMPHTPQSLYMSGRTADARVPVTTFIADDLAGYIDANFRTVSTREGRAIAGLSMGGYGAVLSGLSRPEIFGTVGAFSGAFSAGREGALGQALDAIAPGQAPFVYLACGVGDSLLQAGRDLVRRLEERGIAHEYREVPGGHTWDVWDPQTLAFLDLLQTRPGFVPSP